MPKPQTINYQKLNAELDKLLDKLQSGELDIDDAIKHYERGMAILEQLQKYLATAENKVTKVKKQFEIDKSG